MDILIINIPNIPTVHGLLAIVTRRSLPPSNVWRARLDKVYMDYVTSNLHASMCEKNKLRVYRELKEVFECKKYLYRVPDMGSKLLFRFRSGTHGLNEELGRYITRNVSKACVFCNCDCESVEHVLWECPAYSNNRNVFINSLSKM